MLDMQIVRERPELVKEAARRKRMEAPVDELLEVDKRRRELQSEVDAIRADKNRLSKEIPKLSGEDKASAILGMKQASDREKTLGVDLQGVEESFRSLLLRMPQIPDPDVPDGATDADNVPIRHWGKPAELDFPARDHIEIGQLLDIIDVPRGVKLSGTRNYVLKGDGAMLHLAVLRFALDFIRARGFVPFVVPHLVRDEAMVGTAYFPGGEEQAYRCEKDGLNLIGTSEVPVTGYHSDEILEDESLPLHYAGYSTCYRREAGAAGKDSRGLYRIHQFEKVEQVIVTRNDPEESAREHEAITRNSEELVQALGLPYRVVLVCAGDMGQPQVRKYDIETWMPSRSGYGETHSSSKFYDFQARRLMMRYRDKDGKTRYCHTLNNTLVASPRILIPILETYQEPDGSVRIPDVLQPYVGKARIERR